MKTLEQTKNDYAVTQGYFSWENLFRSYTLNTSTNDAFHSINSHENELMKIYVMECLKLASENIIVRHDFNLLNKPK